MKVSLFLSALLIFAAAVNTQEVVKACVSDAAQANYNAFLPFIKNVNSAILLSAVKTGTFTKCKEIWDTQGTCCDEEKLAASHEEKSKGALDTWGKFKDSLKKLEGGIDKLKRFGDDATAASAAFKEAQTKNAALVLETGLTEAKVTEILAGLKTFKDEAMAFKTKSKQCFKDSTTAIGEILCYGCSATGWQYFTKVDNNIIFKFKPTTCNKLVESCATTWGFLTKVQATLGVLGMFGAAKGGAKPVDSKKKFKKEPVQNILDIVKKCVNGKVESTCTQDELDKLCTIFLNFQRPPRALEVDEGQENGLNQTPPPARLLQTGAVTEGDDSGTGSTDPNGAKLGTVTSLSASANLDMTDTAKTSGLIGFSSLLALFVLSFLN